MPTSKQISLVLALGLALATVRPAAAADRVIIGSKIFTESYILSEIAAQILEKQPNIVVERKMGVGSTGLLLTAITNGQIDLYSDYSGTLAETLLKNPNLRSLDDIRAALKPLGLTISESLGFNNTYALAVRQSFARRHQLTTIGDLAKLPSPPRAAFSYEFMERSDGFDGLVKRYKLPLLAGQVDRMEHSLVYQAMQDGAVDLIEVYSTDANIKRYQLQTLIDDRQYFPSYQAVWVARLAFAQQHPRLWQALKGYEQTITEDQMQSLNAAAEVDKISFAKIAAGFLGQTEIEDSQMRVIWDRTKEHLTLVGVALLCSVLLGIPLGIAAARYQAVGQIIVLSASVIQTIPAMALLVFLIPLFGIGLKPALVALFLYGLLPVIVNTRTGIQSIEAKHLENAKAFGMTKNQMLRKIILPLASPMIVAGLKTATIIGIGTATLAALIGAGGYGALIISGLSLNDVPTILMGAIPAAVMALLSHGLFEIVRLLVVPKGLRIAANRQ